MRPGRTRITTKAVTALLALALMAGTFTACGTGTGNNRTGGRVEADGVTKPEYGNEETTPDETSSDEPAPEDPAPADEPAPTADSAPETTTGGTTGGATDSTGVVPDDYVFDEECWHVQEFTDFGITYTQIMNGGSKPRQGEIDYLTFKVYANDEDCKAAYDHYYSQSKDFDKGHWEESMNWFISDEWGVTDATSVWMVYREGNILIIARLAHNGKWIIYGGKDPDAPEPAESTYKSYVLNNADGIIAFVKEHFLESN